MSEASNHIPSEPAPTAGAKPVPPRICSAPVPCRVVAVAAFPVVEEAIVTGVEPVSFRFWSAVVMFATSPRLLADCSAPIMRVSFPAATVFRVVPYVTESAPPDETFRPEVVGTVTPPSVLTPA